MRKYTISFTLKSKQHCKGLVIHADSMNPAMAFDIKLNDEVSFQRIDHVIMTNADFSELQKKVEDVFNSLQDEIIFWV